MIALSSFLSWYEIVAYDKISNETRFMHYIFTDNLSYKIV